MWCEHRANNFVDRSSVDEAVSELYSEINKRNLMLELWWINFYLDLQVFPAVSIGLEGVVEHQA